MTLRICHGRQPFFRCQPRHYHCGHGGGNNYGTIFNVTNNCCGGHTSGWNSLLVGASYGLTNWVSGLMGMGGFGMNMMNPWAGMFQMAAPFGFQGNGWWNTSGGSDKSEESSKDYDKYAGDKNAGNADTPELRRLTDEFNTLVKDDDLKKGLADLKAELEELIDNPKDEANKTDDIKLYKDLLKGIEAKLNAIPDSYIDERGKKEKKPSVNTGDPDANKVTANIKKCAREFNVDYLPKFYNFTKDDLTDLEAGGMLLARDVQGEPLIRKVKNDVSWSVNQDTLDIELVDSKLGPVSYKFLGVNEKGEYVYEDISTHNGEQLYLLQYTHKIGDKIFYLMQYEGMPGAGSKAHPSNK